MYTPTRLSTQDSPTSLACRRTSQGRVERQLGRGANEIDVVSRTTPHGGKWPIILVAGDMALGLWDIQIVLDTRTRGHRVATVDGACGGILAKQLDTEAQESYKQGSVV